MRGLQTIKENNKIRILLFTSRPEYFDPSDLVYRPSNIDTVHFSTDLIDLESCTEQFDLALVCSSIRGMEHKVQLIIRERQLAPIVVVWTWDNHHDLDVNLRFNSLADLILPAHSHFANHLKTPHAVLGPVFPLPTAQWSRNLVSSIVSNSTYTSRDNALYGGYVLWPAGSRNETLFALARNIPGNAIRLMHPNDRGVYFARSRLETLREWIRYKVSVVVPFNYDLSLRVFDALITGQIPIVPASCTDIESVIPRQLQIDLPVIRVEDLAPSSVNKAWGQALERFDLAGADGIMTRHNYARENHHISCRILQIVRYLTSIEDGNLSLIVDDAGVGLVDRDKKCVL